MRENVPIGGDIRYTRRAQRDLDALASSDRQRILKDIQRLCRWDLPMTQLKKLKGFDPPVWQMDSGAFRVFYRWEAPHLWILGALRKPQAVHRLRQRDPF